MFPSVRPRLVNYAHQFYDNIKRNFSSMLAFKDISYHARENDIPVEKIRRDIKLLSEASKLGRSEAKFDLTRAGVIMASKTDIEISREDQFTGIHVLSEEGATVEYGEYGVLTSSDKPNPKDLLKYRLEIPPKSEGIVVARKNVPLSLEFRNPATSYAHSYLEMENVLEHELNKKRFGFERICELSPDDAERVSIELQRTILYSPDKQKFGKETVAVTGKLGSHGNSSAVLMAFRTRDGKDSSTDMHYHPGERFLIVVTGNRPAGAIFNFCGVAENPDDRKDSEVVLEFPPNSILQLRFPQGVHHKFTGDFICDSIHLREGENFRALAKDKKLFKGFLQAATIFSADRNNQKDIESLLSDDREHKKLPYSSILR